jgi:hypothetical protein
MDTTEQASADTLKLYALRDSFNLYELACLAHGADPERVMSRAFDDVHQHWQQVHGTAYPGEPAHLITATPERILGDEIGGTLKALCVATGGTLQRAVPKDRAGRLLAALGLKLELARAGGEEPEARAVRRLHRFRELGGAMRQAGAGWHVTGQRGALQQLSIEERAAGCPRWTRQDVKDELIAAWSAEQVQS